MCGVCRLLAECDNDQSDRLIAPTHLAVTVSIRIKVRDMIVSHSKISQGPASIKFAQTSQTSQSLPVHHPSLLPIP